MATKQYYKSPVEIDVEVVNNGIIKGRSKVKLQRGDRLLDEIQTANIAPNEVTSVKFSADTLEKTDIGDTIDFVVSTDDVNKIITLEIVRIPEFTTSREEDNDSFSTTSSQGPRVKFNSGFEKFACRISKNSSGFQRVKVYDYDDGSYIYTGDISNKNAGDIVIIDQEVEKGIEYGVEIDANGANFTHGYNIIADNFPYDNGDVVIIGASDGGTKQSYGGRCINDIGNPNNILE